MLDQLSDLHRKVTLRLRFFSIILKWLSFIHSLLPTLFLWARRKRCCWKLTISWGTRYQKRNSFNSKYIYTIIYVCITLILLKLLELSIQNFSFLEKLSRKSILFKRIKRGPLSWVYMGRWKREIERKINRWKIKRRNKKLSICGQY